MDVTTQLRHVMTTTTARKILVIRLWDVYLIQWIARNQLMCVRLILLVIHKLVVYMMACIVPY